MGDLVLAVDCSTTASKAIAWDREGHAVADARAPLEEIRPTPSESEQVAEGWWDATAQALREVVEAVGADRVAGLCITHQRESYAPVDPETGRCATRSSGTTAARARSSPSWASASATTSCTAAPAAGRR